MNGDTAWLDRTFGPDDGQPALTEIEQAQRQMISAAGRPAWFLGWPRDTILETLEVARHHAQRILRDLAERRQS